MPGIEDTDDDDDDSILYCNALTQQLQEPITKSAKGKINTKNTKPYIHEINIIKHSGRQ
jgi:hypothetical protein